MRHTHKIRSQLLLRDTYYRICIDFDRISQRSVRHVADMSMNRGEGVSELGRIGICGDFFRYF